MRVGLLLRGVVLASAGEMERCRGNLMVAGDTAPRKEKLERINVAEPAVAKF
jgi:hypothetical protein